MVVLLGHNCKPVPVALHSASPPGMWSVFGVIMIIMPERIGMHISQAPRRSMRMVMSALCFRLNLVGVYIRMLSAVCS